MTLLKSKKFQTSVLTVLAVLVAHYTGNQVLADQLGLIGMTLIAGIAAADWGKEARK